MSIVEDTWGTVKVVEDTWGTVKVVEDTWGTVKVVEALIVSSITCVCTSNCSNCLSNLSIIAET